MLDVLGRLRIEDEAVRDWFERMLRERTRNEQQETRERFSELNRQLTTVQRQHDQLLNLRLLEEIDQDTFASKSTELRDQAAKLTGLIEVSKHSGSENGEIAVKAFELSQVLVEKWLTADYRAKRRLLEIVCLNFTLEDVSLCPVWRKPFDALAETAENETKSG